MTTQTTTPDDVIAQVTSQLTERLQALTVETERLQALQAEADRIRRALSLLTDGSATQAVNGSVSLPAPKTYDALSAVDAGGAVVDAAPKQDGRRGARLAYPRVGNDGTLREVLTDILQKEGPLPAADVIARAQASGFQTKAKDFKQLVYVTLSREKAFKRRPDKQWTLARKAAR